MILAIDDILATTPDGIQVRFTDTGRIAWLPRNEIDFIPRHVVVPIWLFKHFKQYNHRTTYN